MTEAELQDALLLALPSALPRLRVFRRQVHMVRIEGRMVRAGIRGQADLYGVWRGGLHLEIELKAYGGTLRRDQIAWRDFCRSWETPWLLLVGGRSETKTETVVRWMAEIAATAPG